MADIRINSLSTTASASSSDDYIALDGTTNGTRKLNAYSPTFGGNLTVSGTGLSSVAGAFNVTGALLAHQTAALNLAYEGSSISQLVAYGADVSTLGRAKIVLRKAGTGTDAVTVADFTSTATTLAGNLTVSGTGTSSFASGSKLGVGTTSPGVTFVAVGAPATLNYTIGSTSLADIRSTSAAATNSGPSLTFSGYYQTTLNTSTYGAIKGVLGGAGDGNSAAGSLTFLTANGAGSLSESARLSYTGNLLLGTTTDSGNGKLQLATHTTSAGGIGFGTDTAFYRNQAGGLNIDAIGGTTPVLYLRENTVVSAHFYTSSGTGYFGTSTAASLLIRTNNTTALTLDSSQRAQFASIIGIGGSPTTGIYATLQGDPGTFTYTNADSWIGYRSAVERAGTTGVGYGMVSQLRVASGTQTYGVGIIAEIPGGSGTVTNFQHIRIGGRDLITGNYAIYDNSGYDTRLGGTLITQAGTASTPASASATGTAGMIKWDASYIYVCTAANTWKRVAIATW